MNLSVPLSTIFPSSSISAPLQVGIRPSGGLEHVLAKSWGVTVEDDGKPSFYDGAAGLWEKLENPMMFIGSQ